MTRNPLIPTPTVDKNGRQTTVHKRADTGASKAAANIPMVALKLQQEDNCHVIINYGFESDLSAVKMSDNVRAKMMSTLNENTLETAESILRDYNEGTITFRKATNWCAENRNFAVLNGYVALLDEAENKDRDTQLDILYAMKGLQYSRHSRAEIDITNPDDENAEGGRALVKALIENRETGIVVRHNLKKNQSAYTFRDHEVGTMIVERPDRVNEIVDLYIQHGRFDRGLFEAALENNVQSLHGGVL